jgi:hypothetical protein
MPPTVMGLAEQELAGVEADAGIMACQSVQVRASHQSCFSHGNIAHLPFPHFFLGEPIAAAAAAAAGSP